MWDGREKYQNSFFLHETTSYGFSLILRSVQKLTGSFFIAQLPRSQWSPIAKRNW